MGTVAARASLLLAFAASTAFVFLPTTTRVTATGPGSASPPVTTHRTLLEHEGSGVFVVLAVPVAVAALGAVAGAAHGTRLARGLSASLLWVFTALGAASVGLFYAPAALVMTVAACAPPFSGARTTK